MTKDIIVKGKVTQYTITEDGVITNKRTGKVLKNGRIDKYHRYVQVNLTIDGKRYHTFLHRLLMETFKPVEGMEDLQVNHIDGDRNNNSLSNLEWVTPSENILHAFKHNLRKPMRGELNGRVKLTKEDVEHICEDLIEGNLSEIKIAEKYGVARSLIHRMRHKQAWPDVTEKYDFPKVEKGNSKLSRKDVREICECILAGMNNDEIAEIYGVTPSAIKDIRGRRTWRYITEEYF